MMYDLSTFKPDAPLVDADWIVPRSRGWRLLYLFATTIAPWACLLIFGSFVLDGAEWQDGLFQTYVELAFSEDVWPIFAPLMAYGSLSMALLLYDPSRFSPYRLVRFGVYLGTLVAIQFIAMLVLGDAVIALIIGLIAGVGFAALGLIIYYGWSLGWDYARRLHIGILIGVGALLLIPALYFGAQALFWVPIGGLAAGVTLCPLLGMLTSYRLIKHFELTELRAWQTYLFAAGGLAAYVTSISLAVNQVLELYNALPTEPPPDCYVATASAKGHRRIVGATVVLTPSGRKMPVTRQLQLLKGGELALKVACPSLHRLFRSVYDRLGPRLAAKMGSPWVADLGYLLLKPFELLVWLVFKLFWPRLLAATYRLYANR